MKATDIKPGTIYGISAYNPGKSIDSLNFGITPIELDVDSTPTEGYYGKPKTRNRFRVIAPKGEQWILVPQPDSKKPRKVLIDFGEKVPRTKQGFFLASNFKMAVTPQEVFDHFEARKKKQLAEAALIEEWRECTTLFDMALRSALGPGLSDYVDLHLYGNRCDLTTRNTEVLKRLIEVVNVGSSLGGNAIVEELASWLE